MSFRWTALPFGWTEHTDRTIVRIRISKISSEPWLQIPNQHSFYCRSYPSTSVQSAPYSPPFSMHSHAPSSQQKPNSIWLLIICAEDGLKIRRQISRWKKGKTPIVWTKKGKRTEVTAQHGVKWWMVIFPPSSHLSVLFLSYLIILFTCLSLTVFRWPSNQIGRTAHSIGKM